MATRDGRKKTAELQEGSGETEAGVVDLLKERVGRLEMAVTRLTELVEARWQIRGREWYGTSELAQALEVSQYTVQVRWCAAGRIKCEKDPETKKWRIPASEYSRLVAGGSPGVKSRLGLPSTDGPPKKS
jgi:hypothetical protein